MSVDPYECQPADWDDPHDLDFDPDVHAQAWAGRAPKGRIRCAGCGVEWDLDDEPSCKCDEDEE